jgi:branched-chain amino acid transport system permease protein
MLDIANIASRVHPARFVCAYIINCYLRADPILIGIVMLPVFFVVGMIVYQLYYHAFESRGEQSIQGLAFFFGLLFVAEVSLILIFGVDYRFVEAPYIGPSLHFGIFDLPLRMLIPFAVSLVMVAVLQLYLTRSFIGRAILAVSQDALALRLMAADPIRIKRIAFGISIATCALAGAFLIIIQPVEPSIGRDYIGRIFAICCARRDDQLSGMVMAAILIGIVESITATFYGHPGRQPSRSASLLITLAVRPAGCWGGDDANAPYQYRHVLAAGRRGRDRAGGPDAAVVHQRVFLFRRLCRAAIHRAGDGVEHSRRLYRLYQFRHRRVLRDRRLQHGRAA